MSLKIIGGVAKGYLLKLPSAIKFRPTSIMLRRRVFDRFQSMKNHIFCDLCAGSGAMGFEAMSRGATEVYWIDINKKNTKEVDQIYQEISQKYQFNCIAHIILKDCLKWFNEMRDYFIKKNAEVIIFFDPPYEDHELYRKFLIKIKEEASPSFIYWIESDEVKGYKSEKILQDLNLAKDDVHYYRQGDSFIMIFRSEDIAKTHS